MLVFEEGGKLENPKKTLGARARTNNKLNPHMTPGPGIEPAGHIAGDRRALSPLHHPCTTPAPVILYLTKITQHIVFEPF